MKKDKDLSSIRFSIVIKPIRTSRKATSDGFNGFGKQRSNQNVSYGTYSFLVKKAGIYWIKNKITNLIYIGSSKDIGSRIIKHFSQLRKGNHPNHLMLADYNKYGQSSFDFGVFEFTDIDLFIKERDYQRKYSLETLYNLQIKDTHRSDAQRLSCKTSSKETHKTIAYKNKMKALKNNRIGKFEESTGNLLETFESSDEVCAKYNIAKSTLLGCCNGSKKRALGFIWHYLDANNNIMLQGKGRKRDIIQNEDIV